MTIDKIAAGTLSGASNLILTSLSSSYIKYEIIFSGLVIAVGSPVNLVFRTSTNNGSTYNTGSSDYIYREQLASSGSSNVTHYKANDSSGKLIQALNASGDSVFGSIEIFDPMDPNSRTTVITRAGGMNDPVVEKVASQRENEEANNAISIYVDSGATFSMAYVILGHKAEYALSPNVVGGGGNGQSETTTTASVTTALANVPGVTVATGDLLLLQDVSNSNTISTATAQSIASTATGRLLGIQVFKASGTYTPTAGTTQALIKVWGAGGGGGTTNSANCGSGGGGGAYVEAFISNSASQTITIGSGGSGGGANNGIAAGNGTATSFGSIAVAAGGTGGGSGGGGGGVGGTIASCTVPSGGFAMPGSPGGSYYGGTVTLSGGASFANLSFATGAAVYGLAGLANTGTGGGGGTSTVAGGAGGTGLCIIEEYT